MTRTVGLAEVLTEAVPQHEFVPPGQTVPLVTLPLTAKVSTERLQHPETCDSCVAVRWLHVRDRHDAVLKSRFRRPTFQPIKQSSLVAELLAAFQDGAGAHS